MQFIIQKLYVPTSLGHLRVFKTEPHIQQNSAEFSRIQVHLEIGSIFSHGAIQSALSLYFAPSWECSRAPPKKQRMERHVASARKCFLFLLIHSLQHVLNPCYIVAIQPSKCCKGALIEESTSFTRSRSVPGVSMQQCPGGKH